MYEAPRFLYAKTRPLVLDPTRGHMVQAAELPLLDVLYCCGGCASNKVVQHATGETSVVMDRTLVGVQAPGEEQ